MENATVPVTGPADRLVMAGVGALQPILQDLRPGVFLIGGLMTRIWAHARSADQWLTRATADIDLGIDRKGLRIASDSKIVARSFEKAGFSMAVGTDQVRFSRHLSSAQQVDVDVLIAPGASRHDPPLLERDTRTVYASGLAYAINRGPSDICVEFVDGEQRNRFTLPLPTLEAAFVMKALVAGVRKKQHKLRTDSTDAITLAGLCCRDHQAVQSLREARKRTDVGKALRFLEKASDPNSNVAAQVSDYFSDEPAIDNAAQWASEVAKELLDAVG